MDNKKTQLAETLIPLSDAAREVFELVSRPIQQRQPVSYHREFLERYQPNVSDYLSESESRSLMSVANTTVDANQLGGTHAKLILNRLLIDLSWNSSRLEGNTYSLLETQRLIQFGKEATNKNMFETQMILNHKDAIEFLVESAGDQGINAYFIRNLHALLANNLLSDPGANGRLRSMMIGISHSVYEPLAIPATIAECFELIAEKASKVINPVEQAFFLMVHLPYLQPFDDVNKRVSRVVANMPLLSHNLSPLSFVDVPKQLYLKAIIGVYELNRVELLKDMFIWAYKRSAQIYTSNCENSS